MMSLPRPRGEGLAPGQSGLPLRVTLAALKLLMTGKVVFPGERLAAVATDAGGANLALVALILVFAVLIQGPAVFAFAKLFPVMADGATSALLALGA